MKVAIKSVIFMLALYQQGSLVSGQNEDYRIIHLNDSASAKKIITNLEQVNRLRDSDIKTALIYASKALNDAKQISSDSLIAESNFLIGVCYDNIGAYPEALDYLTNALTIFTQNRYQQRKASTLEKIGYIHYYSLEFPVSLEYFKKIYDLGRELKDSVLIIKGLIGCGSVYGNTNKMDSAIILFNESLDLAKRIGDKSYEVQSYFYIGDVYLFSDQPGKALEVFRHIEENYDTAKINQDLRSNLYNSITRASININVPEMAKHYNRLTSKVLDKNSRLQRKRDYYYNKFQIDTLSGDYRSALKDFMYYRAFYDSIYNSEARRNLANLNMIYELRKRESEITQLRAQNALNDLKNKQRRLINYGVVALVFLFTVIIYQILRTNRKIKEKNALLQAQDEELKTALLNLKNTQNQLIQSEKMAAVGILVSGVSHEINNPLNYILGGAECIKEYCDKRDNGNKENIDLFIDSIKLGVEKISEIVQGLKRFSRSGESFKKELNIYDVINTCVLMLDNLTENRINVVKDFTGKQCIINGIEDNLHQIILSVLLNAIQSIDETGIITIRTDVRDSKVIIQIADTGCGISKENLSRIMDPFFTTKDPGKGIGLGLSITYSMLKEHNGTIEFRSSPGDGTEVTIMLPLLEKN